MTAMLRSDSLSRLSRCPEGIHPKPWDKAYGCAVPGTSAGTGLGTTLETQKLFCANGTTCGTNRGTAIKNLVPLENFLGTRGTSRDSTRPSAQIAAAGSPSRTPRVEGDVAMHHRGRVQRARKRCAE